MLYSDLWHAYLTLLALIFLVLMYLSLRPHDTESYPRKRGFNPRALVIVPCKGIDLTLGGNLLALKDQSYRNYGIIAVVDSKSDPALDTIRKVEVRSMVSDLNCSNCSGKVRAIASAIKKYQDYDVYVVVDSDCTVSEHWLADIVAPLSDTRIGVSTTFPVFRPLGGFWSKVKSVWGFVGQGLMEYKPTRFAWGGTMAFRRDLLDEGDFGLFSESVSDDIPITRAARLRGLGIAYVSSAAPVVNSIDNYWQFREWSDRQTAWSIAGYRRNLYYGVAFYTGSALLLLSGIALAMLASPVALILLLPFLIGGIRIYQRTDGMKMALLIYPIMSFVYLSNITSASRLGKIRWRGRYYPLKGL